jgi:hypothetical protein
MTSVSKGIAFQMTLAPQARIMIGFYLGLGYNGSVGGGAGWGGE